MFAQSENKDRLLAGVYTFLATALLIFLTFLIVFKTPLPPYEETGGGGVSVNFGTSDQGLGDVQPEEFYSIETTTSTSTSTDVETQNNTNQTEKILTQDTQDAPYVASSDKKTSQTKTVAVAQPKITEPIVNTAAIYKKKTTAGQGITQGPGDQGKINGDPNSTNYNGDGGNGTGGKGTGTGNGIGDGDGPGKGISFSLKGRKNLVLPKPEYKSSQQGKVVVLVTVDQDGNVTKAVAGQPGSTTTDLGLQVIAEKAALKSKFDANPNAPEEQKGTITYIFLKQN